jgi:hypothetical protein
MSSVIPEVPATLDLPSNELLTDDCLSSTIVKCFISSGLKASLNGDLSSLTSGASSLSFGLVKELLDTGLLDATDLSSEDKTPLSDMAEIEFFDNRSSLSEVTLSVSALDDLAAGGAVTVSFAFLTSTSSSACVCVLYFDC